MAKWTRPRIPRPPCRCEKMIRFCLLLLLILLTCGGCARQDTRIMETTAYCGCGQCCSWERGNWKYLRLDVWNRYVNAGPDAGRSYSGLTAAGDRPVEPSPGLFSVDSLTRPWMIPFRLVFPWLWLPRDGTIAADTGYYPFGTRMHIPGYGWGVVSDRGSAIKGPDRLDLYFDSHRRALAWGRQRLEVTILR